MGQTLHSFFIPIERGAEYFEDIGSQIAPGDRYPVAFLDEKRAQLDIRLTINSGDEPGTLQRRLNHRKTFIQQYTDAVAARLVEFNKELAEQMTAELNTRKTAISRAERELAEIGLPRVRNSGHAETIVQTERLLQSLGRAYTSDTSSADEARQGHTVRSFIVHGHDEQSLLELKDYLQNTLKMDEPVVLRQMPGLGKTLVEKFEREAEAIELAFVLLTPDDKVSSSAATDDEKRRARQNVIFELGFFFAKLGRGSGRVLLLHKGPLEIPSEISGIEYIDISDGVRSAGEDIRRELQSLGILR